MTNRPAILGGEPIRKEPLPHIYPGAAMFDKEEINAVNEVINAKSPFRYYGPGLKGYVKKFENAFGEKIGSKHVLGVTSGTAALIVALKAAGIEPGDKVIVPACTFIATAGAVVCAGGVPVFADTDDSLNIDPEEIVRKKDKYTKAVIVVPTQGNPCEMDRITQICKEQDLILIEDTAQSCGSKFKGKYSGTFGDIGCFSLQLNKILTTGEGGVVVSNNDKMFMRAVRYHDHGMLRETEGFLAMNEKDDIFIGQNYRMNELSGALAFEQLKKLDDILHKTREIKKYIKDEIKDIEGLTFRRILDEEGDTGHFIMMFSKKSKEFIEALNAENISSSCFYGGAAVYLMPQILNRMTVDKRTGFPFNQFDHEIIYERGMCPNTEKMLPQNISINLSPNFTQKDTEDIIKGIKKVADYLF